MIIHPEPTATGTIEDFVTSEGLRTLLDRLHRAGPDAWRTDPVAGALMEFAAGKYAQLARKHHLDRWEAAGAAFDVMRTKAARRAEDPWAVITHAVRITCIAEERAQGLLCSTHQARRPRYSVFHDAERFSDRENVLSEYHPAFQVTDAHDDDTVRSDDLIMDGTGPGVTSATRAVDDVITLLTLLGWPAPTARPAVEHVCSALTRAGNRHSAYEALRRDMHARALLDLPGRSWSVLLRVLLGTPSPALAATAAGRGVLVRLLIGETVPALLRDDDLVLTITLAAPTTHRRSGR